MRHFKLKDRFWRELPVMKLREKTGSEGIVCLLKVLTWAAENFRDDTLRNCTPRDIENAAEWRGASGAFYDAMAEAGCVTGGVYGPRGDYVEPFLLPWSDPYLDDADEQ